MSRPLTLDRFRELADAYGGAIARWPEDQRDAAARMASQPAAIEILARASALDESLDGWRVSLPSVSLRDDVIGRAPKPAGNFAARARLWWSGVGIAAALAGVASGTAAVAMVTPIDASSDGSTSFGDVGAQEN